MPAVDTHLVADASRNNRQEAYRNAYDNISSDAGYQESLKNIGNPARAGVADAYQTAVNSFDSLIDRWQSRSKEASRKNELEQRNARSRAVITGIGETLSSLANLIGVGNWASSQPQNLVSPGIVEGAERARKEYQIRMDDINERLDRLKTDQDRARMSMKLGLAEYDAQVARDKAKADALAAKIKAEQEEAAARRTQDERFHDDEMALEREKIKSNRNIAQAKIDAQKEKENKERQRSVYGDPINLSYYGEDGKTRSVTIGSKSLEETGRRNYDVLRDEIAESYGFNSYQDYLDQIANSRRGRIKGLSDSASKDLKELSNDFDKDEIQRLVDKYGVKAPRFMSLIEASAGDYEMATQENTGSAEGYRGTVKTGRSLVDEYF